jgi:hypothetical protein
VKGALRAQAERICRTIRVGLGDADGPVAVLFGDTKRRGRLAVEEFRRIDGRGVASQQFVAIDRFTGGQAHGKLYLFEHADRPVMRGALTLDLADDNGLEPALGLLALLLRDLVEGDITFGLGAAKGYGACRARIVGLSVGGVLPQPLAAGLAGAAARGWPIAGPDLGRLYGDAVNDWVGALHGQGATESPPSPAAAVGGDAATGEPDPGAAGGAGPAAAAGEPDPGAGGGAAPAAATGGGSDVG